MFDISGFIGKVATLTVTDTTTEGNVIILGGILEGRYLRFIVVFSSGKRKGEVHFIPSENVRLTSL